MSHKESVDLTLVVAFLIHYIISVRVVEKICRTTLLIWGAILGSYAKRTFRTIGASNAQFGSTCILHKLRYFPACCKVHRLSPSLAFWSQPGSEPFLRTVGHAGKGLFLLIWSERVHLFLVICYAAHLECW
ncbi:unnamed protein product [Ixodes pacificus]